MTNRLAYHDGQTPFEPETPFLGDITKEDTQRIGGTIAHLQEGDVVKATNNDLDFYVTGEVTEKTDEPDSGQEGYHEAIIRFGARTAELTANWRDIPPTASDQVTPYTGLILQPFNDTAPAVTDIEVVAHAE